jgi:hypothetical protein
MTRIQITDLSSFDSQLGNQLEELKDEELLAINGGGIIPDAMDFVANQIHISANVIRFGTYQTVRLLKAIF